MTKQIVGHPDYYVTDSGEVISAKGKTLRVLVPDRSNGYPRVNLDGDRRYLADLIAEYFLGLPEDPSYKLFYIDGDKNNCDISNLKWLSQSDIQRYSQYLPSRRVELLGSF